MINPSGPSPYGKYAGSPPVPAGTVYLVRRSYWSWLGRVTRIFGPDGSLVCYVKHPLLRRRQEMTLYADEAQTRPLLVMRARDVISRYHDVLDPVTEQRISSVHSRTLGIISGDQWDLLDVNDRPVGQIVEGPGRLLRRIIPIVKNGSWDIELAGQKCGHIRELWRLFSKQYTLDLSMNDGRIYPVLAMACTVLALNRETEREDNGGSGGFVAGLFS